MKRIIALTASLCALGLSAANADTITNGFTFAVGSACGDTSVGTHFHSSTGGDFGNPAGQAEVGSFGGVGCEEVRGTSEYDLMGLSNSTTAFVTFDVSLLGGLFDGDNDFLYNGMISVIAYQGNNTEDISDYEATAMATLGTFTTAGLSIGDTLSFDIATVFNDFIDNSLGSLGIRLAIADDPNGGAITFENFRLTTDDLTSDAVPLPAGFLLMGSALVAARLVRRRKAA